MFKNRRHQSKRFQRQKKSSLEAAASAYGTSAKLSGRDEAKSVPSFGKVKAIPKTGKQPVKAGSVSNLKPSKETGIIEKKIKGFNTKRLETNST